MRSARVVAAMSILATALAAEGSVRSLAFEANEGQWPAEIAFAARGRAGTVLFTSGGVSFADERTSWKMSFAGTIGTTPVGRERQSHRSHYFLGSDPARWRSGVAAFAEVWYRDLYPGIDAVFHSRDGGELEYDFVVRPGADPGRVRLHFGDAVVTSRKDGGLEVTSVEQTLQMKRPIAYQGSGLARAPIQARYRRFRDGTVGFSIGSYDRSRDLVIDPVVLGYSTYLGGSDNDMVSAIAVDSDRNIYLAGSTTSPNFPAAGGIRATIAGGRDAFITKLNPAGDQILFSTFIGGSGEESARGTLAVDSRGNIHLAGSTASVDFPTTEGAPQRTFGGGPTDAFVVKVSADGARLLFGTYLGGEEGDPANGLALDARGDLYVAGSTSSTRFPVSGEAFQRTLRGTRNAYVARLRADPPSIIYATYLGGTSDVTLGLHLAAGPTGAAYLTGRTLATDFPTTPGAFQTTFGGAGTGSQRDGDGFVAKVSADGSSLLYSTFLGGLSGEIPTAITVDRSGAAYVTGLTYSRNFPTTEGAYQPQHAGGDADNFVTAIRPAGDGLLFSTLLGGNDSEQANTIALDAFGNVHVSGSTSASDFPTTDDAHSRSRKGSNDAFVSVLSSDGSRLLYSTYLGGTAPSGGPQDNMWALAVDGAGNTWVGGQTRSADFPTTPGALQQTYHGLDDGYLSRFVVQRDAPAGEARVIPVVGSTAGAGGSFFKTSFQLHNPFDEVIGGRMVFHPLGRSGADDDPHFDYFIRPGETISISDLLPAMATSGLGSVDLLVADGQEPESVIRIFNDAGELGTSGMSEEPIRPRDALRAGRTGVLLAPISPDRSRFNIGIRTLGDGATVSMTLRRNNGAVVHRATRTFPPHYFEQRGAAEFVEAAISASDSIAFQIEAGAAVIYGATTDNITQDPSLQFAWDIDSGSGETRPYFLVVGSAPGVGGSFFRTSVQLHNPGSSPMRGVLVYHPMGRMGTESDPSIPYELLPGQTIAYEDLLPTIGLSGLGTIDLISTAGPPPVGTARIFNDGGPRGTAGMAQDQVTSAHVLGRGDTGVLIAPPDILKARLNIGVRTLGEGATITMTTRASWGDVLHTVTRRFDPVFFTQTSAPALLEADLQGNESVTFRVDEGSAIVYGATTDNITQDSMLKIVRRR